MGTSWLSGGRMFSSVRMLRTRLLILTLILFSSGHQQQLKFDVNVGSGADANGMVTSHDSHHSRIIDPTIFFGTYRVGTGFNREGVVGIDSS